MSHGFGAALKVDDGKPRLPGSLHLTRRLSQWLHFCADGVVEVKPGSPAAEAGVKEGDVILTIGKGAIGSYDDLVEAIFNLPAGQTVEMKVLRGLDEHPLTITPRFAEVAEVR